MARSKPNKRLVKTREQRGALRWLGLWLEHCDWNPTQRLLLTRVSLCASMLAGVLFSWKLWVSSRTFPHYPYFDWFPLFVAPFDWMGLAILLASLIAAMVWRRPVWIVVTVVILMIGIAIQDQTRWQPWVYLYLVMMLPMAWLSKGRPLSDVQTILDVQRLIIIACYLWAGIHKIGPGFIDLVRYLMAPLVAAAGDWFKPVATVLGYLGPVLEIAIAVCLFSNRYRNVGVLLACSMHLFLLLLLGPIGRSENPII